jgi:hypothetical protein
MNVTDYQIEEVDPPWSDTLPYRVTITGEDIAVRPIQFLGKIGDELIWALAMQLDGKTLVGWMGALPNVGATLLIGYEDEPMIDTGL